MTRPASEYPMTGSASGQAMTGSRREPRKPKFFFSPQVSDYSLL